MLWRILDELFPGIMFFRDRRAEKKQKLIKRDFCDIVKSHAENIASLNKNNDAPVELWADALKDEHSRINNIESKARTALGVTGVIIPLTVLIGPQVSEPGVILVIGAMVSLLYLAVSLIQGLRANSIGMRVYINPEDYIRANDALMTSPEELRNVKIVQAAITLATRDQMAELNRYRVNATDASLHALRNGLIAMMATALVVVCTQ